LVTYQKQNTETQHFSQRENIERCEITDISSGRESGRNKEAIEDLVVVGEEEGKAAHWDRKNEVLYDALESREG
jgi:hypothetical protein